MTYQEVPVVVSFQTKASKQMETKQIIVRSHTRRLLFATALLLSGPDVVAGSSCWLCVPWATMEGAPRATHRSCFSLSPARGVGACAYCRLVSGLIGSCWSEAARLWSAHHFKCLSFQCLACLQHCKQPVAVITQGINTSLPEALSVDGQVLQTLPRWQPADTQLMLCKLHLVLQYVPCRS